MNGEDDSTPPHGTRIPATRAEVRPGPHIAEPARGELPPDDDELWRALDMVRRVFAETRSMNGAFNDLAYHRLRPQIVELYQIVKHAVKVKLEDDEMFELFVELRGLILRKDA